MLVPGLFLFAFASGVAAAASGAAELRLTPRSALLSRSFWAFLVFELLLLLPVSLYFYVFHGDWACLYVVDVRRVPSAVAVLLFALELAIGAGGFATGAALVRSQRRTIAFALIGATGLSLVGATALLAGRMAQVGSYAQFKGGFGMRSWTNTAVLPGVVAMLAILLVGLAFLVARLITATRRSG